MNCGGTQNWPTSFSKDFAAHFEKKSINSTWNWFIVSSAGKSLIILTINLCIGAYVGVANESIWIYGLGL